MSEQMHDLAVARALVKCLLKGKDFVTHCEARLGEGAVPELDDFDSRDVVTIDRCCTFLEFVADRLNTVRYELDRREAQPELPLGGQIEEKEEALSEKLTGKRSKKAVS